MEPAPPQMLNPRDGGHPPLKGNSSKSCGAVQVAIAPQGSFEEESKSELMSPPQQPAPVLKEEEKAPSLKVFENLNPPYQRKSSKVVIGNVSDYEAIMNKEKITKQKEQAERVAKEELKEKVEQMM